MSRNKEKKKGGRGKHAKNLMIELLTDPRIVDDDYLFFGNYPLQPPPDTLNYVGDLNTGRAYTETCTF